MNISLNYYDYKLLVEQTVINYYGNLGKILPNSFSSLERIFFMNLLIKYNVGNTQFLLDERRKVILNIDTIINNMKNYRDIHNCSYDGRIVYRLKLDFSNVSKMYFRLKDLFNFGYDRSGIYKVGLMSVKNYIEIWDQTYINSEEDHSTSVLFLFDPKGKTIMDEYDIPVVLFDLRLGSFLGIPPKHWIMIKQFMLDCRSNLFL